MDCVSVPWPSRGGDDRSIGSRENRLIGEDDPRPNLNLSHFSGCSEGLTLFPGGFLLKVKVRLYLTCVIKSPKLCNLTIASFAS